MDRLDFTQRRLEGAYGLAASPLITMSGYTWTLTSMTGLLLEEAERRYGERDPSYTFLGIEFCGDFPQVWYPKLGRSPKRNLTIMLSDEARTNWNQALFQLAHEIIHLLAPNGANSAIAVEEGLATSFSIDVSNDQALGITAADPAYLEAERLVRRWLQHYEDAVLRVRWKEPNFSRWTPDLIKELCPNTPDELSMKLCEPFNDIKARHRNQQSWSGP